MQHVHGFDSNGGGNITKRPGFCETADAARPNQTFEQEFHVSILRGVTRATLIFLLDLLKLLRLEIE